MRAGTAQRTVPIGSRAPVLRPRMDYRLATPSDCGLLAELNYQLIRDEGHRNAMTIPELEDRLRRWLIADYVAVMFWKGQEMVAYALYSDLPHEIYLRHLFVVRHRRREDVGRAAVEILRSKIWPAHKRLTVGVLTKNTAAVAFWRSMGYQDYSLRLEIPPRKTEGSGQNEE